MGTYITTPNGRKRFRPSPEISEPKEKIERYRRKPSRNKANHLYFTDAAVAKLKPKGKQYLVWDAWDDKRQRGEDSARGLAVLVSPKGAKSYRACFYFPGSPKPNYMHLGRVGEMPLVDARKRCLEARSLAKKGADPRAGDPAKSGIFETVFKDWVERVQLGKRQNKSARKTEGFVLANCKPLLTRPVAAITASEIEKLLDKIRDGDGEQKPRRPAAIRLFAHLHDFFGWCSRKDGTLKISPMQGMEPPAKAKGRTRVYSDDEILAIWRAAEGLDRLEGDYVKLIFLTALRREELAQAKWPEFDNAEAPTRERFRLYAQKEKPIVSPLPVVLLPPLAQRILKSAPRRAAEAVFPRINFQSLKDNLEAGGAPKGFKLHVARHTISTWLENRGRSEWERGVVLNHASSGVTAGYSHGYPLDLKRKMLEEWAEYIESLVQPSSGVAVLR